MKIVLAKESPGTAHGLLLVPAPRCYYGTRKPRPHAAG
jgi:hypothetical protein